jgi:FlaG protein
MSVQFGHLRLVEPSAVTPAYSPHTAAAAAATGPAASAVTTDVLPASPPDELLDEVGAAFDRVHDLYDDNRELHFEMDPKSNRVVVQVRSLDGTVIRTIPPSEALDIMSGLDTA